MLACACLCTDCHALLRTGAKIDMDGFDSEELNGRVIECTFLKEMGAWKFLRERKDKDTPNAYHVFEKVQKSIMDNITQDFLLDYLQEALQQDVYAKDRADHEAAKKASAGHKA